MRETKHNLASMTLVAPEKPFSTKILAAVDGLDLNQRVAVALDGLHESTPAVSAESSPRIWVIASGIRSELDVASVTNQSEDQRYARLNGKAASPLQEFHGQAEGLKVSEVSARRNLHQPSEMSTTSRRCTTISRRSTTISHGSATAPSPWGPWSALRTELTLSADFDALDALDGTFTIAAVHLEIGSNKEK